MKDIYFFPKTNTICWVAGYTWDDNTDNVASKIQTLTEHAQKFADFLSIPFDKVQTYFVHSSRRYKSMRCFYAQYPKAENMPEGVFVCRKDADMFTFLTE